MIRLNPMIKIPWIATKRGKQMRGNVMFLPYKISITKRIGKNNRKLIRFDKVLTVIKINGTKFGRRTRFRL